MLRLKIFILAGALCSITKSIADDASPRSTQTSLADLEARAPKENQYPTVVPQFHRDVIRLVESNTLTTGDEFFRAANIAAGPFPDFRALRTRNELTLAAVAKGRRDADNLVPTNWGALLQTLGRPMRFDMGKLVTQFPDDDQFALDRAPKSIQLIMLYPGKARETAATAVDNTEFQKLVDADQAIRKCWRVSVWDPGLQTSRQI